MKSTTSAEESKEARPNVLIDAAKFAKPAPSVPLK
jgi:hypothetical protein